MLKNHKKTAGEPAAIPLHENRAPSPATRLFHHFAVGIANSAPFSMLSGQRCMIDFCFV